MMPSEREAEVAVGFGGVEDGGHGAVVDGAEGDGEEGGQADAALGEGDEEVLVVDGALAVDAGEVGCPSPRLRPA